jgi:hypothetical protein
MNPIQTNKPVFFGNDGDVLKSGRIYIGQPNQYPISFPKTVTFQDSSGAQFEAQQPLRTNDQGQISFNGKAIIALVDGNYSLLVQDRNGVQINDGYTPFVSNPGEAEINLGSVTQVGLLLSDIKLLDVTPGDTVRNVGKITATDGLGADWLVVSNTGNPADDETLIDFANGTQGQRIGNVVYFKDLDPSLIAAPIKDGTFSPNSPTLVWSGSETTGVDMASLSEGGTGMYILVDDSGESYWLYVVDLSIDSDSGITFFSGTIGRQAAFRSTDDSFLIFEYNSDTGAFIQNIAVTAIYKV